MITGQLRVTIPSIVVIGSDIKATINFYALNPGALYWRTFLVADCPALGLRKLLDEAREIGQEGGREKTYDLGKMPVIDGSFTVSIFLFAHDNANYQWDWGEYYAWLGGYSTKIQHLASFYGNVSPIQQLESPQFHGMITSISPVTIRVGSVIDISMDFNAYTESLFQQINGWWTRVVAVADGYGDKDSQFHTGRNGSRAGQTLQLGTMPNKKISGKIYLQAHVGGVLPTEPGEDGEWVDLHNLSFSISPVGAPEIPPEVPPGEELPEEGEGMSKTAIAALLIGGGLAVAAIASGGKGKHST